MKPTNDINVSYEKTIAVNQNSINQLKVTEMVKGNQIRLKKLNESKF